MMRRVGWACGLLGLVVSSSWSPDPIRAADPPAVTLESPTDGETWYAGCQRTVRWSGGCGKPSLALNAQYDDSPSPYWVDLDAVPGGPEEPGTSSVAIPENAELTPGQAHVRLLCGGTPGALSRPFTVTNAAPPPAQAASMTCEETAAGLEVRCDATASCPGADCRDTRFRWRWQSDGPEEERRDPHAAHTYAEAGRYPIHLSVSDRNCATAGATVELEVLGPRLPEDPFWLSDHPELLLGQDNIAGGVQFNRVQWQEQVWINGIRYFHAIGMHPGTDPPLVGYADFQIPTGARYFRALFGLARQDTAPGSLGDAAGRIYLDGTRVWEGRVIRTATLETPAIPIPPGTQVIRFEVDALGDRWSDHTTWANPRFTQQP